MKQAENSKSILTSILLKMCKDLRKEDAISFAELAKLSPGYVGADLNALQSEAGMIALKRIYRQLNSDERDHPTSLSPEQLESVYVTRQDFFDALQIVQPSAKREGFASVPDVSWDRDVGALD